MHGFWERVADILLWLQLCWVFFGFVLMAYLAFKVFPNSEKPPLADSGHSMAPDPFVFSGREVPNFAALSASASNRSILSGTYGPKAFPAPATGKVIPFGIKDF